MIHLRVSFGELLFYHIEFAGLGCRCLRAFRGGSPAQPMLNPCSTHAQPGPSRPNGRLSTSRDQEPRFVRLSDASSYCSAFPPPPILSASCLPNPSSPPVV